MKKEYYFITLIMVTEIMSSCKKQDVLKSDWLNEYNVVWDTQSKNSSESMPYGGGDIGLNVWVEDGDIFFYIDRSGNIDENDQQRKSGRIRVHLSPNSFKESDNHSIFEQKLDLKTGAVKHIFTLSVVQLFFKIWR